MTESERIKLTILLHQYTPAERLTAMEIATILEFIEGRGFTITQDETINVRTPRHARLHQDGARANPHKLAGEKHL
jgi:hypothetical protein